MYRQLINDKSNTRVTTEEYDKSLEFYKDILSKYKKSVEICMQFSEKQGGIDTDGRCLRANRIFTRQTVTAMTLMSILPGTKHSYLTEQMFCDVSSIATLSRNILDGYYCILFFGIENIDADEADLRFHLYQLHTNIEKRVIFHDDDKDIEEYRRITDKQKEIIYTHPYLSKLKNHKLRKVNIFSYMYKSKLDYETERHDCYQITRNYRLLSNFAHPTRLAIERIDNINGRGDFTYLDCSYTSMFTGMALKYLSLTIAGYAEKFPSLKAHFVKELEFLKDFHSISFFH